MDPSTIDRPSVTYRIEHTTRYEYGALVSTSQHVACLQPRTLPGQRLDAWALAIDPPPARVTAAACSHPGPRAPAAAGEPAAAPTRPIRADRR